MATYTKSDKEIGPLVAEVMERREPDLAAAGVTVRVLLAYGPRSAKTGALKGPALKSHGWPAAGKIKITPLEKRVAGLPDAILLLDGDQWPDWNERRREALVAHETHHLVLVKDKEGGVKLDDAFRPVLKIREHDKQLGVFLDVMEEYGKDSIDAEVCMDLRDTLVQREFAWMSPG